MSEIQIKSYALGPVAANCYVVYRKGSSHAVVIDPADRADVIAAHCRDLGVVPEAVLLTHGHFDHILAADEIRKKYQVSIYACKKEKELLERADFNLSKPFTGKPYTLEADVWVSDGEKLAFTDLSFEVMETPGHTAGSVCYYMREEAILFSGDTLFAGSYGRVDFPTSSPAAMVHSLRDKLFLLPDETLVYPGHNEASDIKTEKRYNAAVASWSGGRER